MSTSGRLALETTHILPLFQLIMGVPAYQQTVDGILNALNTNMHVITNTTLMPAHIASVEEHIQFWCPRRKLCDVWRRLWVDKINFSGYLSHYGCATGACSPAHASGNKHHVCASDRSPMYASTLAGLSSSFHIFCLVKL